MNKKSITEMLDEYSDSLTHDLPANWTHREHDVRNDTLEEVALAIYALPINSRLLASFAVWIRAQKSGPGGRHD